MQPGHGASSGYTRGEVRHMHVAAAVAVVFVALLHLLFLVLEMFLWATPRGRKIFGTTRELAEGSAKLAANQGLYNGFLAAGLLWGLFGTFSGHDAVRVQLFFLGCVIVAGLYGGLTTKRSILVMQALPGVIAAALVYAAG
jgi:putative membrane protein